MFRKGDVVVCIVDENKDAIKTDLLTLNKCYTVEWEDPLYHLFRKFGVGKKYSVIESFLHNNICVTDDKSYPTWIKSTEFISLKELRTQKLNKIL